MINFIYYYLLNTFYVPGTGLGDAGNEDHEAGMQGRQARNTVYNRGVNRELGEPEGDVVVSILGDNFQEGFIVWVTFFFFKPLYFCLFILKILFIYS